ncbi:MGDG synthase family glycosyltransferase [Virgibacillus natechei]|nr:glycosyltransferase [Virgibacillus natechei]UZD11884.1 UDP-glucuronosyltransferase [Virgibacillus natechei]
MLDKKEALFLPFMQITTGHHHVANTLMDELEKVNRRIRCHKVDILSYSYGRIEGLVSSTYLAWIQMLPQAYDWIYSRVANKKLSKRRRQFLFEALFTYSFKRLMKENNPSILFCTHALPSHIAGLLKRSGKLNSVIVNVYTDYFVNHIWGIDGVDYHIVPSKLVKEFLMRNGVEADKIFVTGIPVDAAFHEKKEQSAENQGINVLVTGGSLGVGAIDELLPNNESRKKLHYYVLCGENEGLYTKLMNKRNPNVTPLPYIESKEEMNHLYDKVDAVLTKPGGVTVSESLMKRKVLFVCNALPGQEKVNLEQLKQLQLAIPIDTHQSVETQIVTYFSDKEKQEHLEHHLEGYHHSLETKPMVEILNEIISISDIEKH